MGIATLFAAVAEDRATPRLAGRAQRPPSPRQSSTRPSKLAFEKEMLGLYISDHPLMGLERALAGTPTPRSRSQGAGRGARRAGLELPLGRAASSPSCSTNYTKTGELMARFVLEDLQGAMEVFVFPKTMAEVGACSRTTPSSWSGAGSTPATRTEDRGMGISRPEPGPARQRRAPVQLPLAALTDARWPSSRPCCRSIRASRRCSSHVGEKVIELARGVQRRHRSGRRRAAALCSAPTPCWRPLPTAAFEARSNRAVEWPPWRWSSDARTPPPSATLSWPRWPTSAPTASPTSTSASCRRQREEWVLVTLAREGQQAARLLVLHPRAHRRHARRCSSVWASSTATPSPSRPSRRSWPTSSAGPCWPSPTRTSCWARASSPARLPRLPGPRRRRAAPRAQAHRRGAGLGPPPGQALREREGPRRPSLRRDRAAIPVGGLDYRGPQGQSPRGRGLLRRGQRREGPALVVFGWAMAEDLAAGKLAAERTPGAQPRAGWPRSSCSSGPSMGRLSAVKQVVRLEAERRRQVLAGQSLAPRWSSERMAWASAQSSQTSSRSQPKRTQVEPSSWRRKSWGPRSATMSATEGRSPRELPVGRRRTTEARAAVRRWAPEPLEHLAHLRARAACRPGGAARSTVTASGWARSSRSGSSASVASTTSKAARSGAWSSGQRTRSRTIAPEARSTPVVSSGVEPRTRT